MKKRLSILLCIAMMLCLVPTTAFAKTVKAKSVSIAPKSMTLAVDDIAQLSATMKPNNASSKLTWTSSDETIATVSNKGLVQGKAKGTATITVETSNGKTATCSVKVKEYAEKTTETPTVNTTGDIFATIKDRIITLIKSLTYTKSEIDKKIASSGGGSSDTIVLHPQNSCVYEFAEYYNEEYHKCYTSVEIDAFTIDRIVENSYEDFLKVGKYSAFRKYEIQYSITGSVPSEIASIYNQSQCNNPGIDICLSSNISGEDMINRIPISSDGTFSGTFSTSMNELPKDVYLDYIYIYTGYGED